MNLAETIWKEVEGFFVGMFKNVWSGFLDMIAPAIKSVYKETVDFWGPIETQQWEAMLSMFTKGGLLDDEAAEEIKKLKDLGHPLDWIFYLVTFFNLSRTFMNETILASAGDMRKAIYSKYTPASPSASDVLKAAFVAPEVTENVRNIMKQNGLSDDDIDLIFLSNYRLYDEYVIRDLYLRGVLNDDQLFMRMRELGYTDTRIQEITQSWSVIPPINDILRMVGREAFEPELYEYLGLNQEFPTEQAEWFEKQGLSRYWQEKYWIAHWEEPSLQMGFEMLHRRVITTKDLDTIYKAVEIPPFWRDKLTAISYLPYTRVDARRMHKLGVLTDDQLVGVYMDQGYDEEHARNMALFTIRYNAQEESELNKSEIMKAYKEDAMSREDAKTLLMQLHYTGDLAEYHLTFADYLREKDYHDDLITNIGDSYKNRLIERTEAKEKLDALNLPSTQVTLLLSKWDIQLFKSVKFPSKTDLDKFLTAKIIDEDTYILEMDKLGYNYRYTQWYLQLSQGKKKG